MAADPSESYLFGIPQAFGFLVVEYESVVVRPSGRRQSEILAV